LSCRNLSKQIEPDSRDRPREFSEPALIPKDDLIQKLDAVIRETDLILAFSRLPCRLSFRSVQ